MADKPKGGEGINESVDLNFNVRGPDPNVVRQLKDTNRALLDTTRLLRPLNRTLHDTGRAYESLRRTMAAQQKFMRDPGVRRQADIWNRQIPILNRNSLALTKITVGLGAVAAGASGAVRAIHNASDSVLRLQLVSRDASTAAGQLFEAYKKVGGSYASIKDISDTLAGFKSKGLAQQVIGDMPAFQAGLSRMQDVLAKKLGSSQAAKEMVNQILQNTDVALSRRFLSELGSAQTQAEFIKIAQEFTNSMDDAGKSGGIALVNAFKDNLGDETSALQWVNKVQSKIVAAWQNFQTQNPIIAGALGFGGQAAEVGIGALMLRRTLGLGRIASAGAGAAGGVVEGAGAAGAGLGLGGVALSGGIVAAVTAAAVGIWLVADRLKNGDWLWNAGEKEHGNVMSGYDRFESKYGSQEGVGGKLARSKVSYWRFLEEHNKTGDEGDMSEQDRKQVQMMRDQISGLEQEKQARQTLGEITAGQVTTLKQLEDIQAALRVQLTDMIPLQKELSAQMERTVSTRALAGAMGAGYSVAGVSTKGLAAENSRILNEEVQTYEAAYQQAERAYAEHQQKMAADRAAGTYDPVKDAGKRAELTKDTAAAQAMLANAVNARAESYVATQEETGKVLTMNTQIQRTNLDIMNSIYGAAGLGLQQQMAVIQSLEMEKANLQEELNVINQKITEGDTSQAALKKKMDTQARMNNLIKQELDMTKNLRDGYLNAIQAQVTAAGAFESIIITQEKNTGLALSANMFKANYLLGQIGSAARATDIDPMRFTSEFGRVEAGGESMLNQDQIQKQIENIGDPTVRAMLMAMANGGMPDVSAYAGAKAAAAAATTLGQGATGQAAVGQAMSGANPNAQPGFYGAAQQTASQAARGGSAVSIVRAAMDQLLDLAKMIDAMTGVHGTQPNIGAAPSSQPAG